MKSRRTALGVAAAVVLVGLASWLGRSEPPAADTVPLAFPRDEVDSDEGDGDDEAPSAATDAPAQGPGGLVLPGKLPPLPGAGGPRGHELAMRRALSPPGTGHLVINSAALLRSELAQRMLRCRGQRARAGFDRLREVSGVDLQRDVDAVGMSDKVMAVTGRIKDFKLPPGATEERYGDGARLVTLPARASEGAPAEPGSSGAKARRPPMVLARIGDHTLLVASSAAEARAAVDRFEGRAASEPVTPGNGDVQGQLLPGDIATFLGSGGSKPGADGTPEQPMAQALRRLTQRARLRMNVNEDVAMSLDFDATDASHSEELAQTIRGGVALMRQAARQSGRSTLEGLLDRARFVEPDGEAVGLDLALPGSWILARMGCDAEGRPLPRAPAAGPTD